MKRYLICTLAALALALNAEAAPRDKEKEKPPVVEIPKDKDKDKYKGPVFSVPDTGSTALLLGTAILAVGVASRRFATR
jgi:VPDSG-CTERM motif